ncbi:guanine nucleotide exchange factor DBS-like [Hoplias malabaricus]|uniref:guanine nucleotide exchange factor DBS-like n=1 Tax=Hoplias malabaricus TaxID=27720 RepID=UPI003462B83E
MAMVWVKMERDAVQELLHRLNSVTQNAASEETKTVWVREIRKLLTGQLEAYREARQQRATDQLPSENNSLDRLVRDGQNSVKDGRLDRQMTEEENDNEPSSPDDRKQMKATGSFSIAEAKAKRQEIKSDPTPLETGPHPYLGGVRRLSTSSLFPNRRRGWTKGSLSLDASVEHDGYFSAEDQVTSDPEEEREKKQGRTKGTLLSQCVGGAESERGVGEESRLPSEAKDGHH